jgi:large subunit ribosomal protein L32
MAVPKKKTPKSKRDKRRSHHGLSLPNLIICPQCKQLVAAHSVCSVCGTYRGKQVLDADKRKRRKERKEKAEKEKEIPGQK